MTLLPVVERELRAAARHPFTYSIRMLAVAALIAVFVVFGLEGGVGEGLGGRLFAYFHFALFCAIWILVPLLTADCLSRERREGTLALLFLTPLRPPDILWAKGFAHGLRALTLWLAALPLLTIPFIVGGVAWREVILSVLANFSSLCLAISAGLVASASNKVQMRAVTLAAALGFAFLVAFAFGLGFLLNLIAGGGQWSSWSSWFDEFWSFVGQGFALAVNWGSAWQQAWRFFPMAGPSTFLWVYITLSLMAVLMLLLLMRLSAWMVRRVWQEEPPSARVVWLKNKFCRPIVFRPLFARWMRWELHRNPIGWLERRTWSGRLVMWSWFAVVIAVYTSAFTASAIFTGGFHAMQVLLAWLLVVSMTVSAAGSFRRERETGVLELLLVAPLHEWQIIGGRVRGLWGQFMPAAVLLVSVWIYGMGFLGRSDEYQALASFSFMFATLPIIGLYFSLARGNFIGSFLRTLLFGVVVPAAVAQGASVVLFQLLYTGPPTSVSNSDPPLWLWAGGLQIALASYFAWRLHLNLRSRKFALEAKPG